MSKTIQMQYTNPVTGAETTKQVTIDVDRYRIQTDEGDMENFFIKASGAGADDMFINIDDLVADLLDGRPSHAKHGIVQSLVDTNFTADGTTLSVTPAANLAGFVANVPCVVLDKYGDVKGYFIPTVAGADFTIPSSGGAALAVDCKVGWIVQQLAAFRSSEGENSELGIKAQAEQPSMPTLVLVSGTGTPLSVAFTKPSDAVIQKYDVYCIKADTVPASIEANSLPSAADQTVATGISITQYFDETAMVLTNLVTGNYFIGVIAKDGTGMVDVNESEIAWSALKSITVS